MSDSLKVNFELDLSKESDRQLVEIISRVKALQAQGQTPSIVSAAQEALGSDMPSADAVREVGREITEATNQLAHSIPDGERQKLNTKERASVAAKARWARERARKEGKPLPPTTKEVKKKELERGEDLDYSGAEQQDFSQFPQVNGIEISSLSLDERHNLVLAQLTDSSQMPFPDGREIIDGSWERRTEQNEFSDREFENPFDEEFVRRVHEQAARYEAE